VRYLFKTIITYCAFAKTNSSRYASSFGKCSSQSDKMQTVSVSFGSLYKTNYIRDVSAK